MIFLPFVFGFFTYSQPAPDILDVAAEYNKKKSQVMGLEEKRRKALSDLYAIEKETGKIVLEKSEFAERKLKLQVEIKDLSKQVVELEAKIAQLTPSLIERTALIEKVKNLPWFYSFLSSQDITDLDRIMTAAERMNQLQAENFLQFLELLQKLNASRKELTETARQLVQIKKKIDKKEARISQNQWNKKKRLGRIEKHLRSEKRRLKNLKGQGQRLLSQSEFSGLGLLFGSDFFDKKGQLPQPIQAPLVHGFGLNQGLILDSVQLVHKGHFYSTAISTEALGVAEGRVHRIQSVEGFGMIVVIDQGGRYYTVYGNLASTPLKVGQLIEAGALVGKTGPKHLQLGRGLYFEVRHFSQPQDPKKWLKKRTSDLATL